MTDSKTIREAKAMLARFSGSRFTKLVSMGANNPKLLKSDKLGKYLSAIVYIAPHSIGASAGCGNVCSYASKGCRAGCLYTAGNPVYLEGKERTRLARKRMYFASRQLFFALLVYELTLFVKRCERKGKKPAVRLNGTSDIAWEVEFPELFDIFSHVQFYDYTKNPNRLGRTPRNYHLTLSRSEANDTDIGWALSRGHRVAVVVSQSRTKPVATEWNGYATEDGDTHDLTFARKAPVVLLRAKGPARNDCTGFVDQKSGQDIVGKLHVIGADVSYVPKG
jgi:hypothetical protein